MRVSLCNLNYQHCNGFVCNIMSQSNSDIQVVNFEEEQEEIEIIGKSGEEDILEITKSPDKIGNESEDEIFMEEEDTEEPCVFSVEQEDSQLKNEPVQKTQIMGGLVDIQYITKVKTEDSKVVSVAEKIDDGKHSSSQPRKKKAKVAKGKEDLQVPSKIQQNPRIKVETDDSWDCPSDSHRLRRRAVKREATVGESQFQDTLRNMKREPLPPSPPSPSLSAGWEMAVTAAPHGDGGSFSFGHGASGSNGAELSAMRQLLTTLQKPVDDDEVFGAHVASELRALRRPDLKRKLKRLVQEAILVVAREDDLRG